MIKKMKTKRERLAQNTELRRSEWIANVAEHAAFKECKSPHLDDTLAEYMDGSMPLMHPAHVPFRAREEEKELHKKPAMPYR